jgi:hypothetical protein
VAALKPRQPTLVEPTATLVLGFDPSTTRTGYSCLRMDGTLIDCGAIVLDNCKALDRPGILFAGVSIRIRNLVPEGVKAIAVIEWPDQHTNAVQKGRGFGAGLARYGTAPGIVYGACAASPLISETLIYTKNTWSPGKANKTAQRQRCVYAHPLYAERYAKRGDAPGDIAEAIGIAEYAIRRVNLERSIA